MLKGTLDSSLRLIRTKNLYSDGDELSVVYCTWIVDLFFGLDRPQRNTPKHAKQGNP